MSVVFVVDSASDVDIEEADKRGICLIPMEIKFSDGEYLDGVNLSHRRFFEKLIEEDVLPKTSQINEFRFRECFESKVRNGDEVVAITISSKLSGTYECAVKAASGLSGVYVVDSLNACIGERLVLEYGLKLSEKGMSAADIAAELNRRKGDIKLLALVGTLKYLQMGGRVSKAVAIAGELLGVKPVVSVEDGEVKLIGKALGSKKGNNLLNTFIKSAGGIDFDMPYATAYSGLDAGTLNKYMEDSRYLYEGKADNVPRYLIGSTIGTHVGPGAIAVAFFAVNGKGEKEDRSDDK